MPKVKVDFVASARRDAYLCFLRRAAAGAERGARRQPAQPTRTLNLIAKKLYNNDGTKQKSAQTLARALAHRRTLDRQLSAAAST